MTDFKHGGEAAIKRLHDGGDLTGIAKAAEDAVASELKQNGRRSIVIRNARRLQAACDLFWPVIMQAAARRDIAKLDRYIARFGWLSQAALRAWLVVKSETKDNPEVVDYEEIIGQKDKHSSEH